MIWTLHRASESFERHRRLWDELNRTTTDHILFDSAFVGLLLRHFGSPRVRLAVSHDPQHPGLALLEPSRGGFWQTFQPSQAPLGLLLLGSKDRPVQQVRDLMRALPGLPVGLAVLQQDPELSPFAGLATEGAVEVVPHIRTARLTLKGTFEQYWNGRSKNLTRGLARQRRRLAERGTRLELVIDRLPTQISDGIRHYGQLESAGWKAGTGTAISADNRQGAFYRELLERLSTRGEGRIYRLLLDGKTVAANLTVERNGVLVVLKTTYDEALEGLSAASLLEEEMLKGFYADGRIDVEESFGPFTDWQARWTDDVRTIFHVNFWRAPSLARAWRTARRLAVRLRSGSGSPAAAGG